jgi:large subunit ribosomal protein L9
VGTKIKVLLTQDVTQVGAAGDIREVSGGFGRNYLIPQGYAVLATRGQVKEAEQRAAAIERRRSVERTDAQKLAARIAGITLPKSSQHSLARQSIGARSSSMNPSSAWGATRYGFV